MGLGRTTNIAAVEGRRRRTQEGGDHYHNFLLLLRFGKSIHGSYNISRDAVVF